MIEKIGQPLTQAHLLALDTIDRLQDQRDKLQTEVERINNKSQSRNELAQSLALAADERDEEIERLRGQAELTKLCGIQYASMTRPLPIRCSFPVGHKGEHAGSDALGKVFVFPLDPVILSDLPPTAPIPAMLRNCS